MKRHCIVDRDARAVELPHTRSSAALSGALKKAQDAKQKLDDLIVTEAEERQIGEDVSTKIRERFGVVQDPAIHKYVSSSAWRWRSKRDRPISPGPSSCSTPTASTRSPRQAGSCTSRVARSG